MFPDSVWVFFPVKSSSDLCIKRFYCHITIDGFHKHVVFKFIMYFPIFVSSMPPLVPLFVPECLTFTFMSCIWMIVWGHGDLYFYCLLCLHASSCSLCLCSSANNSLRCILIICVVHTYLLHCQLWRHRLLLFAFVFLTQPLCFRKCIVINMGGAELSQKPITHVKCESHRFINTSEEHFFLKD